MENIIYKITVCNWSEHNKGHKKSYKKTLIANNFCSDSKLRALPVTHRWLFLALLLECGSTNRDTVELHERQVRDLLESSKSTSRALDSLQELQLVSYSKKTLFIKRKEKKGKEKKGKEGKGQFDQKSLVPSAAPPAGNPHEKILEIWNSNSGQLPKARGLNSTRRRMCQSRWRDNPEEKFWEDVVNKISLSNFCTGKNDRGWVATFDWLLKADNYLKVIEGKYDNRTSAVSTAQTRKYDKLDELEQKWKEKSL